MPDVPGTVLLGAGPLVLAHGWSALPGPVRHPLTRLLAPAVSEPPAAHSPLEKPPSSAILCTTCGDVCKGEVLRVQSKYFHIRCFVCKGEHLPAPV